jgi:hypothetical protein
MDTTIHKPNKELIQKATEKFIREVERSKKCKGESKTES